MFSGKIFMASIVADVSFSYYSRVGLVKRTIVKIVRSPRFQVIGGAARIWRLRQNPLPLLSKWIQLNTGFNESIQPSLVCLSIFIQSSLGVRENHSVSLRFIVQIHSTFSVVHFFSRFFIKVRKNYTHYTLTIVTFSVLIY